MQATCFLTLIFVCVCVCVWTDSAEFVLRLGAGVHEGLRDDVQRSLHHLCHVDVEDEVGFPQDVHPKPQREAEDEEDSGQKLGYEKKKV